FLADAKLCPDKYQLTNGICVRVLQLGVKEPLATLIPSSIDACKADGAHLPIINSDAENTMYNQITLSLPGVYSYPYLVLGLVCNAATRRLEWVDGTKVSYSKNELKMDFDCVDDEANVVSKTNVDQWQRVLNSYNQYNYTVLCVTTTAEQVPLDANCGEYGMMARSVDKNKPCYKIYTTPTSWRDAERKCQDDFGSLATIHDAEENALFFNATVPLGVKNGMHIGAHQSSADDAVFGDFVWIEDDKQLLKYNNFAGGFPVNGIGFCSSMQTETNTAYWVNADCDVVKLPFLCRRVEYSLTPVDCPGPNNQPKENEDIFPPGFPHSSIPCEYTFIVNADELVQVEILALETNDNVDFLEIYEGAVGSAVIANLTGTTSAEPYYTTNSSNVMRVNWLPRGDSDIRGFRIQYLGVPKD
ncbi:hypothetical protein PFISCL1PPCAC_17759, partial [Pristionchus fissidentatus]